MPGNLLLTSLKTTIRSFLRFRSGFFGLILSIQSVKLPAREQRNATAFNMA